MTAFVKMMPRIEARETLAACELAALSNNVGFEREADRQRLLDELRRKVTGEAAPAPAKANPADLAGMGIGVKIDGDTPVIGNLDAWLGNGEPENG